MKTATALAAFSVLSIGIVGQGFNGTQGYDDKDEFPSVSLEILDPDHGEDVRDGKDLKVKVRVEARDAEDASIVAYLWDRDDEKIRVIGVKEIKDDRFDKTVDFEIDGKYLDDDGDYSVFVDVTEECDVDRGDDFSEDKFNKKVDALDILARSIVSFEVDDRDDHGDDDDDDDDDDYDPWGDDDDDDDDDDYDHHPWGHHGH